MSHLQGRTDSVIIGKRPAFAGTARWPKHINVVTHVDNRALDGKHQPCHIARSVSRRAGVTQEGSVSLPFVGGLLAWPALDGWRCCCSGRFSRQLCRLAQCWRPAPHRRSRGRGGSAANVLHLPASRLFGRPQAGRGRLFRLCSGDCAPCANESRRKGLSSVLQCDAFEKPLYMICHTILCHKAYRHAS